MAIEYDGEGHFMIINRSKDANKNVEVFINTCIKDNIKDKFCKDNNRKILRIPYWDFKNIEEILSNHIN